MSTTEKNFFFVNANNYLVIYLFTIYLFIYYLFIYLLFIYLFTLNYQLMFFNLIKGKFYIK